MSVVDTNVLVHSTAARSPCHTQARNALARLALSEPVTVTVTRQILREYLAATIRSQSWSKALTLREETDDNNVFARRFSFGGKQVHDANIVATMLAHGETRLLTFNVADFRRFGSIIDVIAP